VIECDGREGGGQKIGKRVDGCSLWTSP